MVVAAWSDPDREAVTLRRIVASLALFASVLGLFALTATAANGQQPAESTNEPSESMFEFAPCADEGWVCELVLDVTGSERMADAADVLVVTPVQVLLIFLVAWLLRRLTRRVVRRMAHRLVDVHSRANDRERIGIIPGGPPNPRAALRAKTIAAVLDSIAAFIIYSIAGITALAEIGVALGPLVASAGIAGVALGFGAQSLVRDFLSGIFMLIEDQFGVGDIIDVGEAFGEVEGVSLRTTRIRTLDGMLWHVPNGEVRRVGNASQDFSRALLHVKVAYGTDLAFAKQVMFDTAAQMCSEPEWSGLVLGEPEVAGVQELGVDGVAIRLLITTRPGEQWPIERALRERLKDAFNEHGIEIPLPQRTLWLRSPDPAESAA